MNEPYIDFKPAIPIAYIRFEHDPEDGWYRMREPTGKSDTWEVCANAVAYCLQMRWKPVWEGDGKLCIDSRPRSEDSRAAIRNATLEEVAAWYSLETWLLNVEGTKAAIRALASSAAPDPDINHKATAEHSSDRYKPHDFPK